MSLAWESVFPINEDGLPHQSEDWFAMTEE